jgi:hypothetical protein
VELLRLALACGAQPVGDPLDELGGGSIAELNLELTEARGQPGAVEHRHLVVDQLRELLAVAIAQHHPVARGVEPRGQLERRVAQQRLHEVDRGVKGLARRRRGDLGTDQGDVGRDRQLDRPALVVAEAEAGAGPGQPQVGGVEVGRLQLDVVGGIGDELVVVERGHAERRPGRELELALARRVLHHVGIRGRGPGRQPAPRARGAWGCPPSSGPSSTLRQRRLPGDVASTRLSQASPPVRRATGDR